MKRTPLKTDYSKGLSISTDCEKNDLVLMKESEDRFLSISEIASQFRG